MNRGLPVETAKASRRTGRAFTLVELLIVIGLLGALAVLLLSNLSMTRTDSLDNSIVQAELADIQRAYRRFQADCVPTQADYRLMTSYGLEILFRCEPTRGWSFPASWNSASGRGWRGPYLQSEGRRDIDITDADSDGIADSPAQPYGVVNVANVPVACTPYVNDADGHAGDYYRVLPEVDTAVTPPRVLRLWVVFPSHTGELPANAADADSYRLKRLLMDIE